MAYRDIEVQRRKDRERFARRTAERVAQGKCPRCGKRPPAEGRSVCDPCVDGRNRASRARDARLRAAGTPRRDMAKARQYERARTRRQSAERHAGGLCVRCGQAPSMPERTMCEGCLDKRRAADRARYQAGKAAGALYGGADVEMKRRSARIASAKRRKARLDAGRCTRCGHRSPVDGTTTCAPCRDRRQAAERRQYEARKSAGLCVKCAEPAFGGESRCGVCATVDGERRDNLRKNAVARKRYVARRARSQCTDCGAPAYGACRCPPCAKRSYERSDHFRGMPVYPPSFAVYLRETEECLGVFDDEMEAVAWLAFERLSADRVEVVRDASPLAAMAAWE